MGFSCNFFLKPIHWYTYVHFKWYVHFFPFCSCRVPWPVLTCTLSAVRGLATLWLVVGQKVARKTGGGWATQSSHFLSRSSSWDKLRTTIPSDCVRFARPENRVTTKARQSPEGYSLAHAVRNCPVWASRPAKVLVGLLSPGMIWSCMMVAERGRPMARRSVGFTAAAPYFHCWMWRRWCPGAAPQIRCCSGVRQTLAKSWFSGDFRMLKQGSTAMKHDSKLDFEVW